MLGSKLRGFIPHFHPRCGVPWKYHRNIECGRMRDFPLPSMGRGIEGEGWFSSRALEGEVLRPPNFPPLTPALSPLRGEGEASAPDWWKTRPPRCVVWNTFTDEGWRTGMR